MMRIITMIANIVLYEQIILRMILTIILHTVLTIQLMRATITANDDNHDNSNDSSAHRRPLVQGLGSRVQGLGFRVQGLGSRVQGLGFRSPPAAFCILFVCIVLYYCDYDCDNDYTHCYYCYYHYYHAEVLLLMCCLLIEQWFLFYVYLFNVEIIIPNCSASSLLFARSPPARVPGGGKRGYIHLHAYKYTHAFVHMYIYKHTIQ